METILKKNLEGYLFYFLQGKHFQWDKKKCRTFKNKIFGIEYAMPMFASLHVLP